VKRWIAAAACVLAGLAAGAIWTLAQADRYRADARVLVRPASSRILPAIETLAESSLVESNVAQTLHLSSTPHLEAKTGKGGVLTVSAEAGTRERARQIDAEAVVILTQTVAQRFGTTPGVTATVLDPAHTADQTSPTPGRNFLIAGLLGLTAGVAGAALTRRRPPAAPSADGVDPDVERRLSRRIEMVTARERALAKHAGELASIERRAQESESRLAAKERELRRREQDLRARESTPVAEPETSPVAVSAPEIAATAATERRADSAAPTAVGRWNLSVLEALVQEHTGAPAARQDEWATYLFLLRQHADVDGVLPPSFNGLVEDVFGDVQGIHGARA
jgi:capsular polysaccharide biosynthesis protein